MISPFPVNGGWSLWSSWETCTVTCGNGKLIRNRFCNNPLPQHSGAYCNGTDYDELSCQLSLCPGKQYFY